MRRIPHLIGVVEFAFSLPAILQAGFMFLLELSQMVAQAYSEHLHSIFA